MLCICGLQWWADKGIQGWGTRRVCLCGCWIELYQKGWWSTPRLERTFGLFRGARMNKSWSRPWKRGFVWTVKPHGGGVMVLLPTHTVSDIDTTITLLYTHTDTPTHTSIHTLTYTQSYTHHTHTTHITHITYYTCTSPPPPTHICSIHHALFTQMFTHTTPRLHTSPTPTVGNTTTWDVVILRTSSWLTQLFRHFCWIIPHLEDVSSSCPRWNWEYAIPKPSHGWISYPGHMLYFVLWAKIGLLQFVLHNVKVNDKTSWLYPMHSRCYSSSPVYVKGLQKGQLST